MEARSVMPYDSAGSCTQSHFTALRGEKYHHQQAGNLGSPSAIQREEHSVWEKPEPKAANHQTDL